MPTAPIFAEDGGMVMPTAGVKIYDVAGVPSNGLGANGDWAFSQNGTSYAKAGGVWAAAGGGGLPSWFQSGNGDPTGSVTPAQKGAVYVDLTNARIYTACALTNEDWCIVGGSQLGGAGSPGIRLQTTGSSTDWGVQDSSGMVAALQVRDQVLTLTTYPTVNTGGNLLDNGNDGGQIIAGDTAYGDNAHGPVIVDQTNGHTYRIISTAGVLSTVQVT